MPDLTERIRGGILGAVLGDAMGLPWEGAMRQELARQPIQGMTGGGPHGQPPGTWSDDSSLLLSLADSLCSGYSLPDIGAAFLAWWRQAAWTPHGRVLGYGATTAAAMERLSVGVPASSSGMTGEGSNGNGSLMRTLPVALYFHRDPDRMLEAAHEVSAITHAHPRSLMCCGIYCLIVAHLMAGEDRRQAVEDGLTEARRRYRRAPWEAELPHLECILSLEIMDLDRFQVRSGGYVVQTLEAAIWSLLRGETFRDCLLVALNLGGDTDTVGCVTGGLAGTRWGEAAVPRAWADALTRREDIEKLCDRFCRAARPRRTSAPGGQ